MTTLYGIVCKNFNTAETQLLSIGIRPKLVAYSLSVKESIEHASGKRFQSPTLFHKGVWYMGISQILSYVKAKKLAQ
ncbi:hypothetical protein GD1_52 [Paraglaciecola Antarctic GD virus 1]|nr:hypothetical protein GD1_52 [Paraglaciecola Antarctic GD virus 1]